jgi:hypothetical protein
VNKPKGFRSEGRIIVDLVDQCKGFSNFYEDLAVPKQLVEFNSDYQKDVSQHIDLIREIINNMDSDLIPISHYEVTAAITKLNNKKAFWFIHSV